MSPDKSDGFNHFGVRFNDESLKIHNIIFSSRGRLIHFVISA